MEYFKIRLTRDGFGTGTGTSWRSYSADDWGVGATAGLLWEPREGTTIGVGYRSRVDLELEGSYKRDAATVVVPGVGLVTSASRVRTTATGELSLPDELSISLRQKLTERLAVLGTVEWQGWSGIGNVKAVSGACTNGVCETLNLNYRDGWKYAIGFEYLYSPTLTLRTGASYEVSPIDDKTRNILIPDSDRIGVSVGASYKYSDKITVDLAYSHLFFDEGSYCIASSGTSSHCGNGGTTVLAGTTDVAVDLVSVGLKYRWSDPVPALEPYK